MTPPLVKTGELPTPMRFSVVVPTYNRPDQLASCLSALSRLLPPPGGFEIVVVNDGGTAPEESVVATTIRMAGPASVRVIQQANAGPAVARNTGVAAARGDFVAFTDDDCIPEPGWLVALDAVLTSAPDALVGGRTVNAAGSTVCADASQLLVDFATEYFDGGAAERFFPAHNLAAARTAFLAAGGFDPSFSFAGEDREFCDRWSAQGRPSLYATKAVVHHAHALNPASFARQHFAYGRGAPRFRRVRANDGRPVRIDPVFYARSVMYPFSQRLGARAPVLALLTFGAHAAYAAGMFWELCGAGRAGKQR